MFGLVGDSVLAVGFSCLRMIPPRSIRGVMIPELELILESELHLFSDSNSRKTESKHLWGVMVPGLESISESDFHMDLIQISEKNRIIAPLRHMSCKFVKWLWWIFEGSRLNEGSQGGRLSNLHLGRRERLLLPVCHLYSSRNWLKAVRELLLMGVK